MADINITFAEVRTKASEIRGLNADLTTKLAEIQSEIKKLEADWTSDASVEIRSKITNLQTRFDEYQQIIEEYAKFLDDTANKYESTESTLTNNLGAFE